MDDGRHIAGKLGLAKLQPGWVWLVGAGPDPGLITALGLQALSQADVILYDALVDETLLTWRRLKKSMPASAPACAAASRTKSPTCW